MELRLTNFRCHENETIRFNMGVTLIMGQSGAGKTTILEAIDYALYGKLHNVATSGQTKCEVDLILSADFKIHRLSGKDKVSLTYKNQDYEGTVAQGIINEMFGEYEVFSASSYMRQGDRCLLMTGSNAEKMSLIRAISFKDSNAAEVQATLKETLKKSQANVASLQVAVTSANAVLGSFDQQHPSVKSLSSDVASTDVNLLDAHAKELVEEVQKIRNEMILIAQKEQKVKTLGDIKFEDVDLTTIEADIQKIDEEIVENGKKIEGVLALRAQKAAADQMIMNQKKLMEARKQLIEARKKREDEKKLKEEAIRKLQEEFDQLEASLKTLGLTTINEQTVAVEIEKIQKNKQQEFGINMILARCKVTNIEELKAKSADMARRIREAKGTLAGISSSVENLKWNEQQQKTLVCPKCNVGLRLDVTGNGSQVTTSSHKLHVAEGFVAQIRTVEIPNATEEMLRSKEKEIIDIENEKDMLQKSLTEVSQLGVSGGNETVSVEKAKLDDAEKLVKCNKWREVAPRLIREKDELSKFVLGDEVNATDGTKEGEEKPATQFPSDQELNVQENSIKDKNRTLENEKAAKRRLFDKKSEKDKHMLLLSEAKNDLEKVLKDKNIEKSSDLQTTIDEKMKENVETLQLKELCLLYVRRKELAKKLEDAQKIVGVEDSKVQGLTQLYEISKRVEREVLENTVAAINNKMAEFLEVLFAVDPIKVKFSTTKDLKSKKAKSMTCSLNIFYKNVQYKDPKQLSGGELDRVSLAMMLTLNALSDSMFILLDESLSSLNSALKVNVVELLRKVGSTDKTCLVIEHEGTEGVYDQVLSMSKGE